MPRTHHTEAVTDGVFSAHGSCVLMQLRELCSLAFFCPLISEIPLNSRQMKQMIAPLTGPCKGQKICVCP